MWHISTVPAADGFGRLQAGYDFARGKALDLELAVSRLAHVFREGFGSAIEGIERLWPAGREAT